MTEPLTNPLVVPSTGIVVDGCKGIYHVLFLNTGCLAQPLGPYSQDEAYKIAAHYREVRDLTHALSR